MHPGPNLAHSPKRWRMELTDKHHHLRVEFSSQRRKLFPIADCVIRFDNRL
jgi:hypothetical protein